MDTEIFLAEFLPKSAEISQLQSSELKKVISIMSRCLYLSETDAAEELLRFGYEIKDIAGKAFINIDREDARQAYYLRRAIPARLCDTQIRKKQIRYFELRKCSSK
ncbi:hypothetical protein [Flavobacterium psychrotrophum]|uniref:hypothetical protein n=1 Tax=Flavobacterium psychrotrophum TaxID=2294119 RepID=UPI000E31BE53|nr:hypothetical protein [Flavobacterium psychrotrophum]